MNLLDLNVKYMHNIYIWESETQYIYITCLHNIYIYIIYIYLYHMFAIYIYNIWNDILIIILYSCQVQPSDCLTQLLNVCKAVSFADKDLLLEGIFWYIIWTCSRETGVFCDTPKNNWILQFSWFSHSLKTGFSWYFQDIIYLRHQKQ